MTRGFARLAVAATLVVTLALSPASALAQKIDSVSGLKCLITIDSPWGEFCLIPDPFT